MTEFIENAYSDYSLKNKNIKVKQEFDEPLIPQIEEILKQYKDISFIKYAQGLSFFYPCNVWYVNLWRKFIMGIELCDKRLKITVMKTQEPKDLIEKKDKLILNDFQDWLTVDKLEKKLDGFFSLF